MYKLLRALQFSPSHLLFSPLTLLPFQGEDPETCARRQGVEPPTDPEVDAAPIPPVEEPSNPTPPAPPIEETPAPEYIPETSTPPASLPTEIAAAPGNASAPGNVSVPFEPFTGAAAREGQPAELAMAAMVGLGAVGLVL